MENVLGVIENLVRSSAMSAAERQVALDVIETAKPTFTTKPVLSVTKTSIGKVK